MSEEALDDDFLYDDVFTTLNYEEEEPDPETEPIEPPADENEENEEEEEEEESFEEKIDQSEAFDKLEKDYARAKLQITKLRQENNILKDENKILTENISKLYRTANIEIKKLEKRLGNRDVSERSELRSTEKRLASVNRDERSEQRSTERRSRNSRGRSDRRR